jgi:Ethylbenzene dehydrogenase
MSEGITRGAVIAGAGAVAGGAVIGAAVWKAGGPRVKLSQTIRAGRFRGTLPVDRPDSSAWDEAEPVKVLLKPQQVVAPMLDVLGIGDITVRALHDGTELGLLVSWDDDDPHDLVGLARFQDALAVQLPMSASAQPPPITMGAAGAPVHLMQWRATWQRDIDQGRSGVESMFPHVVRDVTPDDLLGAAAAVYYPARAVGNPMSALKRASPVEEAVAEGFGSVTTLKAQTARGKGIHDGGRWRVTIGVPMARGASGQPLEPGSRWPVAFALWLGSRDNRGSRKQYADWVDLEVAR